MYIYTHICIYVYIYTWVSINGGTPKSYNFNRIFHEINTPTIGVPPFMETLIYIYIYTYNPNIIPFQTSLRLKEAELSHDIVHLKFEVMVDKKNINITWMDG